MRADTGLDNIESLDRLGKKLVNITENSIVFKETNKYLTSGGFYYEVSVTYCEDEVETTFNINEKNEIFDISTHYKGSLNINYLADVDFNKYKKLNTKFKQLVINSKVNFEDIEELSYMYDYTY